jgi:6-phosphogluconolactonase
MSSARGREALGLPGTVVVAADPDALAAAAADWVLTTTAAAISARGAVHIALSGGSTPAAMYRLLAASPRREQAEWRRWNVWFGDERACPPDDERSNFHLAHSLLLRHVPVDPVAVHRMEADRPDLAAAAAEYSALLERLLPHGPGGAPRLDVILLGLGGDGHTASLFPGDPALDVADAWATTSRATYEPYDRTTLTLPTLNAGAAVAFLVSGEGKREALRGVAEGTVPAARVRPVDAVLLWLLDEAAAG